MGSFRGNLRKLCYTTARTHERVGIPERTPAVQTLPSLNVHPAEVCLECHVRTYHLSCQGARQAIVLAFCSYAESSDLQEVRVEHSDALRRRPEVKLYPLVSSFSRDHGLLPRAWQW
jgi:hypothetical protein